MNTKNLLRLGFLSLFCALGTFAWAIDDVTVSDVVTCYFTDGTPSNTTNFDFTSDTYSTNGGHGSASVNGVTYDACLKIGSSTKVKFTTLTENTVLTIVVTDEDITKSQNIKVTDPNGDTETLNLPTDENVNVFTYTCETIGEYTISRGSAENHVVYIGLSAEVGEYTDVTYEPVTVNDGITCYFTDGAPTNTDYFTFTKCNYGTGSSYGSVVINNTTIDACLKLESNTNVSFTTSEAGAVLTLVFAEKETTPDIYIQFGEGDKTALSEESSNVITYTCEEAGTYTLSKKGAYNVFYIGVSGDTYTSGEGGDTSSSAIEVSDANYCTFAASNEINQTGDITFTLTSNDDSTVTGTGHGTVSLNQNGTEKEYDCCLKLNSHPTLSFSTTEKMTMTLVFEDDDNLKDSSHTDRCITIDGTSSTITSGRVMQVVLESGDHSLTRVSGTEHYLFYVGLSTGDTTGINGVTLQTTGNNIYYNLAGQRVSTPTKGVYILNGKKVLVK